MCLDYRHLRPWGFSASFLLNVLLKPFSTTWWITHPLRLLGQTVCVLLLFCLYGDCDLDRCAIAAGDALSTSDSGGQQRLHGQQDLAGLCLLRHNIGGTQRLGCFLPTDMLIWGRTHTQSEDNNEQAQTHMHNVSSFSERFDVWSQWIVIEEDKCSRT